MKVNQLNRREFLGTVAMAAGPGGPLQSAAQKPNILYILCDNFNPNVLGCAGHPMVRTPNIDRLASRGAYFTNAYCGAPLCAPGRAGLISGMFPSDVGSYCNATPFQGGKPTWAELLRSAGYYCKATGKMDLTAKGDLGFDQTDTVHEHEESPDITALFRRPMCYRVDQRSGIRGTIREREHRDARPLRIALDFLRNEGPKRSQPWALYVGFVGPMSPYVAPGKRYFDMYPPEKVDLPRIPPGYMEKIPEPWEVTRCYRRVATPIPEDRVRSARAAYYANVTAVDERIGALMDALDSTALRDRTVVVFTTDHGRSNGEHGMWQHNEPTDESSRVPFMISGPGIPAGQRFATPVAHVDLFPTLLELGGAPVPSNLRGHSLLSLWDRRKTRHPGFAYSECHAEGTCTGSFVIRKDKWKYIHYTYYDSLLFNMEEDPGEFNNVIDTPEGKRVSRELHEILRSLLDPTEVTERAFAVQERMLQNLCARMSLKELLESGFEKRLGRGQAISLLRRYKRYEKG
jgi:choline-sulfatase